MTSLYSINNLGLLSVDTYIYILDTMSLHLVNMSILLTSIFVCIRNQVLAKTIVARGGVFFREEVKCAFSDSSWTMVTTVNLDFSTDVEISLEKWLENQMRLRTL